jgi:hypothetical protein
MVDFTIQDGTKVDIDAERVIRIRRTNSADEAGSTKTRIDWVEFVFVMEAAEDVAKAVATTHPNLAKLAHADGSPVWFNATKADGPVRITAWEKHDNVQSAIILLGKRLYLSSTPEEVQDVIRAAGGRPLPIPPKPEENSAFTTVTDWFQTKLNPQETWD